MIDIINLFDGLVQYSSQQYKASLPPGRNFRWKYCVALAKCGWKAVGYEKLDGDNINIVWHKEGMDDVGIELSFVEQCIWLQYMERERKNVK